jgi:uncharacterized protein HemY
VATGTLEVILSIFKGEAPYVTSSIKPTRIDMNYTKAINLLIIGVVILIAIPGLFYYTATISTERLGRGQNGGH